jgi:hypothetical protein
MARQSGGKYCLQSEWSDGFRHRNDLVILSSHEEVSLRAEPAPQEQIERLTNGAHGVKNIFAQLMLFRTARKVAAAIPKVAESPSAITGAIRLASRLLECEFVCR